MAAPTLMIFSGNANLELASNIAHELNVPMGKAIVGRFSDGEVMVEVMENVRGRDTYVVQPTCAPTADNFMELLVMIDALKRASASRVTAVIPYFGYARQDRRPRSARVPITAKVAAKMIGAVGCDRVVTIDLHADQIQGFFDIPVDNVYASPLTLADIWQRQSPTTSSLFLRMSVAWCVRVPSRSVLMQSWPLSTNDVRAPMWPRS